MYSEDSGGPLGRSVAGARLAAWWCDHVLTLAVLVPADSAAFGTQPVVRRRSVWAVAS
jgi:hypothetical protein